MKGPSSWKLLLAGKREAALGQAREFYSRDTKNESPSPLGLMYLWLGEYQAAWDFMQEAMPRFRTTVDAFIAIAGAAKWCLDDPVEAVRAWRKGIKTGYSNTQTLGIPLMLYAVSILNPEVIDRKEGLEILAERVKIVTEGRKVVNCSIKNWPGPLALYVLGQMDREAALATQVAKWGGHRPDIVARSHWEADFYEGVIALGRGNRERYAELMTNVVGTVEQNTANPRMVPGRLSTTEFFIARHELYRMRGVPDTGPGATGPIPPPAGEP